MKAHVLSQVTISADCVEVFKYLKNLENHYLWNPALIEVTPLMVLDKGSVYTSTRMVLGNKLKATNTVTKFKDNAELQLENNTGLVHYKVNYKLKSVGKNTLLVCETVVGSNNKAFAFTRPVLEALARRELQSDLQALKLAVEHGLD